MNRKENRSLSTGIVFILISLFSFFTLQAQDTDRSTKTASIDFETEVIDFGTIQQNSNGLRTFTFTNTGNAPQCQVQLRMYCSNLLQGSHFSRGDR